MRRSCADWLIALPVRFYYEKVMNKYNPHKSTVSSPYFTVTKKDKKPLERVLRRTEKQKLKHSPFKFEHSYTSTDYF